MKTYELPLTRDYVRDLTPVEAIREIIQNALDYGHGVLNTTITIDPPDDDDGHYHPDENDTDYDPEVDGATATIRIDSPGASLEPRTLLLGCTSKAGDVHSIGSFGEGYKIALLVLAREGIDAVIYHSGVTWTPSFTRSEVFNEDVLTITEEKDDEWKPQGITFMVRGLPIETIEKVRANTLQLQGDVGAFHRVRQGDILLERPGKLYINGLFVSETGLDYGYNVKPEFLTLERDRQTVSSFDLQWLTKDMWFDTGLPLTVAKLMEEGSKDLEYANYSCPELVKEACYQAFIKRHPGAVVARSQDELEQLVKHGMTNVIVVNATYAKVIQSHRGYNSEIVRKAVVEPHMRLRQFLTDNRSEMRSKSIVAFKALIKEAEGWHS